MLTFHFVAGHDGHMEYVGVFIWNFSVGMNWLIIFKYYGRKYCMSAMKEEPLGNGYESTLTYYKDKVDAL